MGIDGNFERLEGEVERLLEVLEQLKQENKTLQARIEAETSRYEEIEYLKRQLADAEGRNSQAAEDRQKAKSKIENILSRLEQIDLTLPEKAD